MPCTGSCSLTVATIGRMQARTCVRCVSFGPERRNFMNGRGSSLPDPKLPF
jgi:hypothetical protein